MNTGGGAILHKTEQLTWRRKWKVVLVNKGDTNARMSHQKGL